MRLIRNRPVVWGFNVSILTFEYVKNRVPPRTVFSNSFWAAAHFYIYKSLGNTDWPTRLSRGTAPVYPCTQHRLIWWLSNFSQRTRRSVKAQRTQNTSPGNIWACNDDSTKTLKFNVFTKVCYVLSQKTVTTTWPTQSHKTIKITFNHINHYFFWSTVCQNTLVIPITMKKKPEVRFTK